MGQRHLQNAKRIFKKAQFYYIKKTEKNKIIKNLKVLKKNSITKYYKLNLITSYKSAILTRPDLVFICNPSAYHLKDAFYFSKIKSNLFIEKPLMTNSFDFEIKYKSLIKLTKKNKIISMVGYQMRFHPGIIFLKQLIKNNTYGNVIYAQFINCTFLPNHHPYENYQKSYASVKNLGGGVLENLSHEVDIIQYFFGLPKKIYSFSSNVKIIKTQTDNNFASLMKYQINKGNFFDVYLKLSYTQEQEERYIKIQFAKKIITLDLSTNKLFFYNKKKKKNNLEKKYNISRNNLFINELKHLKYCIKNNVDTKLSIEKIKKTQELIMLLKKAL